MNMQKEKYFLNKNLIHIKKEPVQNDTKRVIQQRKENFKARLSLNIDIDIKTDLHMHCVKNKKAMTDVIEALIRDFLNKNK